MPVPPADDPLLVKIREHLITMGLVRDPGVAGPLDGQPYPMFLSLRDGARAPYMTDAQGNALESQPGVERNKDAVITVYRTGGIPGPQMEGFIRRDTVDFWLRTRTFPLASDLESILRTTFHGRDKLNYVLGSGLQIISSREWRGLQPLGSGPQGWSHTYSVLFERYAREE